MVKAIAFAVFIVLDLFEVQAASTPTKVIIGHPIAEVKVNELVGPNILTSLEESGFVEKVFTTYGVK